MVAAASEEWVDDTIFQFAAQSPTGLSYADLAKHITDQAIVHPDLDSLKRDIASMFCMSERDALTAIDRTLGGICRAATLWHGACPDNAIDPVGAAAFNLALTDHSILDAVYPGWRDWKRGYHSKPEEAEQAVPSYGHKPSNSVPSAPTNAPADAH